MLAAWPRRPRLVAGNWKMNKTSAEAVTLVRELVERMHARPACVVAVCPPFTALESARSALGVSPLLLGGQNLHWEPHGAYTGEIAGGMLRALDCRVVIVGHSERRHGLMEDDAMVARKLRAALREGLVPIVCVGETLEQRQASATAEVLVRQVRAAYDGLAPADAAATVIAYEPVWAIGTGQVATPDQACEAHRVIRATLDQVVAAGAGERHAILYGGSVNAVNAAELFARDDVDGALVGGASLDATAFWKIAIAAGG